MKKLAFILLAVGLPLAVTGLANPSGATINGWPAAPTLALGAFVIQWLAFIPARLLQTERFYDLTGSATYIAVTLGAVVAASEPTGAQVLIAIMIFIWAGRLGSFLFRRIHAAGGDQRFDQIKVSSSRFFVAWTLQGSWVVMTSCAAVTAVLSLEQPPLGPVYIVGAAMWLAGFAIEVIADRQKSRCRKDPANAGQFINVGLWARSRHPNYFGEILLWAGMAVMAVPYLSGTQWVVMLSPLFVYGLLTRISGIPTLARRGQQLWGEDPDYQAYLKNTPTLLPRFFWHLKMDRNVAYYFVFAISFLLFPIVQNYIRPNYEGDNELVVYFLGVAPNFLPGVGLPALLYVVIPEVFKSHTSLFRNRLYWSVAISITGLVGNEFVTLFTPGQGVFDWNDIVWTIIGAGMFVAIHRAINKS